VLEVLETSVISVAVTVALPQYGELHSSCGAPERAPFAGQAGVGIRASQPNDIIDGSRSDSSSHPRH